MRGYIVVVLDPEEREVVERVLPSIAVGFPAYFDTPGSSDIPLIKAIKTVAHGYELTHEVLLRARTALERQVAACAIEADVDHWKRRLLPSVPAGPKIEGSLVTDPLYMCEVLADARSVQLREADRALTVVKKALEIATPRPKDEEDD